MASVIMTTKDIPDTAPEESTGKTFTLLQNTESTETGTGQATVP